MATLFIFVLLIIVTILLLFKRVKTGLTILVFALICFIGIGNGFIPNLLLKQLQSAFLNLPLPSWKNKNAIVFLGAGATKVPDGNKVKPTIMAYSRLNEATQLYFNCKKSHNSCKIIISGGDALKTGKTEAVIYQGVLNELGVNNSDILLEPNSLNTYKNAEFTSGLLKKNQFDQVILVTSGIHLRRALLYFSYFGFHPQPASADYLTSQIGLPPLGYNFAMTDFAIHEYLGIARFYIYNFLGWNKHVSSSGIP